MVRAFLDHADAVETALLQAPDPVRALRAGLLAYRAWGVAHPAPFALAHGTPVPGYEAPADRTLQAGARCGDLLVAATARLHTEGLLDPAPATSYGRRLRRARRAHLAGLAGRRGYDLPIGLLGLVLDLFVPVHGFVVMEVFGQLRPLTEDPQMHFGELVDRELLALGAGPRPRS